MKQLYTKGLLAGIAGGIAISAILFLETAFNGLVLPHLVPGSGMVPEQGAAAIVSMLVPLLSYGLYGLLLLLTGSLAVWLVKSLLSDYREALIVSGISGVTASILWTCASILVGVISLLFIAPSVLETAALPGQTELSIMGMVVAMDLCCCGPVFLVVASVLAMIGGGLCGLILVKH